MRRVLTACCSTLLICWALASWAAQVEPDSAKQAEVSAEQEARELGGAVAHGVAAEHQADEPAPAGGEHGQPAASHDAAGTSGPDAHAPGGHGAGGAGAHHDPYDLSHQNAGPQLEAPEEFKSDLAIWTFVVFVCLLAILSKFAWGPIMEGLERREHAIAAMIEDAKQSQEKAAAQLKLYEAQLAAAGDEARNIVVQARKDADGAGERILVEARQAAERERQRAVEDIVSAKNSALQEITNKSVDIAMTLAGRIVRRELRPEDHSALVREALEQLPPSRN